jgi:hypothetical protein
MSIESLLKELQSATSEAIVEIRRRIIEEFGAAKTSDDRARLLAIYTETMDRVERGLAGGRHNELLANFKEARAYDYKSLIAQECLVGGDSPGGGDISVEMLKAVTDREIAAGRMTEDHSARQLALTASTAPHFTHAELLAKHAKLQEEAEKSKAARAPQTPAGNATQAYAFGAALGKKLKSLFR